MTFFLVLAVAQPRMRVTRILPFSSKSIVSFVFGAISRLLREPRLMVPPTRSGVSIIDPATIVAPLTTWAPFTVIGLLARVVRIAVIGGGAGAGASVTASGLAIAKLIWVAAKTSSNANVIGAFLCRGFIPWSFTSVRFRQCPSQKSLGAKAELTISDRLYQA